MTDTQFNPLGKVTAPADWTIPGSLELLLKNVYASFDGSGAAAAFLPCLTVVSDSGHTVGSYVASTAVAAGGSADVTWFPGRGLGGAGNITFSEYAVAGTYKWSTPTNCKGLFLVVVGAGGAGGGGFSGNGGAYHGGGGGGGGATEFLLIPGTELPASLGVTVGAGGIGTSSAVPGPNGNPSFVFTGSAGNRLVSAAAGNGGGITAPVGSATGGVAATAGPLLGIGGGAGGAAVAGTTGSNGSAGTWGGASGGGGGGGTSGTGGASFAGGAGGTLTAALGTLVAGAAGGATAAAPGTSGTQAFIAGGQGAGGGAGQANSAHGGAGGNGYRGGGGGGGGGSNAGSAVAGGSGGDGYVVMIALTS